MRPRLMAAVAATVVATMVGACSAAGNSAEKDVSVTGCTADPSGGKPVASGQIHNNSSKASTYVIHVRFVDAAGNGVGDGVATVGKVEPGATANWKTLGTQSTKGPLTCPLQSATRTVAP